MAKLCMNCGTLLHKDATTCHICNSNNIDTFESNALIIDYECIRHISHDPKFIKAMLELHEKDIIEYELKMSQFRNQVEQQKSNAAQVQNNLPKCPTCGSTNIKKIPASRKMLGAIGFGLLSKTARSQWECNNCGNKW